LFECNSKIQLARESIDNPLIYDTIVGRQISMEI